MLTLPTGLARAARLAAATTLLALPLSLTTVSAAPADAAIATCVAPVIDDADVLDDNRVASIPGADVHVVTFESVPGEDLDRAVFAQRDNCSNWQGTTGGWGSNDIVFALSLNDRLSGVYYGPAYEDRLGNNRWESAVDAMGGPFADGDFTGGINAGIAQTEYLISTDPNDVDTSTPVVSEPSEPLDVPWAWILGVPLGGAVLAGGGFGAVRARRRLAERAAVRAKAATVMNEAVKVFMDLETLVEFVDASVTVLPEVDDDGINAIRADHKNAKDMYGTAMAAYMAHSEAWSEARVAKASEADATTAHASAENARDALQAALTTYQKVETDITDLEARNAQTPTVLDKAQSTAVIVSEDLDGLSKDGYAVTEYRARLNDAVADIEPARAQHTDNLWGKAATAAEAITKRIDAVREEATGLRDRHALIEETVGVMTARHDDLRTSLTTGQGDLSELVGAFHASCVNEVSDQFADGTNAHTKAAECIKQARVAVGMDQQRFDDAEHALAQAEGLLDTATEAFAAPARQHAHLDELAESLSGSTNTAETEIGALETKMLNNREAMTFLNDTPDLDALRRSVQTVAAELVAERPPYLNLSADLDVARGDISDAEQRVDSVIRDYEEAQQAIARARNAVRDAEAASNRAHAGARSKSLADEAARSLRTAENFTSLSAATAAANDAISTASEAESAARSAISSHESAQRSAAAAAARRRSSSGGSGSLGGGGGSRRSSGGGGSKSFGGGGGSRSRGGGGSKKW